MSATVTVWPFLWTTRHQYRHQTDQRRIEQRQLEFAAELLAILGIIGEPLQHHVEMTGLFAGGDGGAEIIGEGLREIAQAGGQAQKSNGS